MKSGDRPFSDVCADFVIEQDTTKESSKVLQMLAQAKKDLEASILDNTSLSKTQVDATERARYVDRLEADKDNLQKALAQAQSECEALASKLDEKEKASSETGK